MKLKKFSSYLKTNYPQLKFSILYFSFTQSRSYDENNKIIILPTPEIIKLENCVQTIANIVKVNKNFINDCVK